VPLLMAGPGVPRGVFAAELAAGMTDLTATLAALAGGRQGRGGKREGAGGAEWVGRSGWGGVGGAEWVG
jgi:hypothetical protein